MTDKEKRKRRLRHISDELECPPGPAELPVLPFDVYAYFDRTRALFPDLGDWDVQFTFRKQPTLAYIQSSRRRRCAHIYVHSVLNHPQTPIEVMDWVFHHELLHLRIPSREVDGKYTDHPPEFWEAEGEHVPLRDACWGWVFWVLSDCIHMTKLKRSRKEQDDSGIYIRSTWKRVSGRHRITFDHIIQYLASVRSPPPEQRDLAL